MIAQSLTNTVIPVVRELPADLETPVSTYLKLAGSGPSFLLESVTGGEQVARYSFIGVDPGKAYLLRGHTLETHSASGITRTRRRRPARRAGGRTRRAARWGGCRGCRASPAGWPGT